MYAIVQDAHGMTVVCGRDCKLWAELEDAQCEYAKISGFWDEQLAKDPDGDWTRVCSKPRIVKVYIEELGVNVGDGLDQLD